MFRRRFEPYARQELLADLRSSEAEKCGLSRSPSLISRMMPPAMGLNRRLWTSSAPQLAQSGSNVAAFCLKRPTPPWPRPARRPSALSLGGSRGAGSTGASTRRKPILQHRVLRLCRRTGSNLDRSRRKPIKHQP